MNVFVCLPNVQITAIASRSLERSQEFAKKHGIPKAYSSYVELANDPDVGEYWAMSGLAAQTEKKNTCCRCCLMVSLEHSCSDRRCVPGSAAHRALASRSAFPWGWEERVVRETFRHELQTSERPCHCSQEEQGLPDGGKVEKSQPFKQTFAQWPPADSGGQWRCRFGANTSQKWKRVYPRFNMSKNKVLTF